MSNYTCDMADIVLNVLVWLIAKCSIDNYHNFTIADYRNHISYKMLIGAKFQDWKNSKYKHLLCVFSAWSVVNQESFTHTYSVAPLDV